MLMVFSIVPNEWACSLICFAKLDAVLLYLAACLCSLNLVKKLWPVWPM
jgi:hypothetical protein